MQTNRFQSRLKRIQDRFDKTFGMNNLINRELRQTVVFSIFGLGLLERKISSGFGAKDIQKFTRTANMLEKLFVKIDCLNKQKTKS